VVSQDLGIKNFEFDASCSVYLKYNNYAVKAIYENTTNTKRNTTNTKTILNST